MKPNRQQRALTAWMLYFSILFGALACAVGHGQMAGLQLSGLDGGFCSYEGNTLSGTHLQDADLLPSVAGAGCVLTSSFAALILAAFFGLLGLLALSAAEPLPPAFRQRLRPDRWPPANPRASPQPLPAL